jgi:hypothetical protein
LKIRNTLLFFLLLLSFSCELEKTIELDLPVQEKQLVAEAYLENNKPFRLLLTETDSYFDTIRFPFVENASITLSGPDGTDTLKMDPFLDIAGLKFYNYSGSMIPGAEGQYKLKISSKDRVLEGITQFLPPPGLDRTEIQYNPDADSAARFLFWIKDYPGINNFYRIMLNEDSLTGPNVLEFTFTDTGQDGKLFPIGTSYRFNKNKEYILRLFHIEQQYYLYLRALSSADRANGNPFAQPSTIKSPMTGNGYGIFTSLNYIEKILKP